jgi:SAM-dependent methyltransferase
MNKKYQVVKSHLEEFGLEFFDSEFAYFSWANRLFEENQKKLGKDISKYLKIFDKHSADPTNERIANLFYDHAASNNFFIKILHSIKSHNIAQSCIGVIQELNEKNKKNKILDLGCNVGYLTSFYAKYFPNSSITGIDTNKKSILKAKQLNQSYENLEFFNNYDDLNNEKFDFIADTQCLSTLHDIDTINETIKKVRNLTKDKGKLVSISNIVSKDHHNELIPIFNKNNFYINKFYPFPVKGLQGIEIYTKLILTKENTEININVSDYYRDLSDFQDTHWDYQSIDKVIALLPKNHYYN